jgi:hypothetical protein
MSPIKPTLPSHPGPIQVTSSTASGFHRRTSQYDREVIEIHRFQVKPDRRITNFHRDALLLHGFTIFTDCGDLIHHREGLFPRNRSRNPADSQNFHSSDEKPCIPRP